MTSLLGSTRIGTCSEKPQPIGSIRCGGFPQGRSCRRAESEGYRPRSSEDPRTAQWLTGTTYAPAAQQPRRGIRPGSRRSYADVPKLRDRRIRGTPIYEATITAKGDVANIRVIRSGSPEIDAAVIAALRQWKFRPAIRKGKPVAVYYTLAVNIDLQ
ncbi:MAG TPA: energy transducer TonB [Thermoanaerobaculia bacterium]|nr:energy transducer TonB [Thermoanaerobaculia bacterium]